jgi:hypothetical protein
VKNERKHDNKTKLTRIIVTRILRENYSLIIFFCSKFFFLAQLSTSIIRKQYLYISHNHSVNRVISTLMESYDGNISFIVIAQELIRIPSVKYFFFTLLTFLQQAKYVLKYNFFLVSIFVR